MKLRSLRVVWRLIQCRSYVELLEQQQAQLVAGIRTMWHDVSTDHEWKREALPNEGSGKVFVHDILDRIGALKAARDYSPDQSFMEEPEQMQEWLATQSHFQNRLPSPPEDSPYQSPAISSRPAPQQITVETPIDTFTSHSSSPLGSSSPSTAASSALHTPTSPHFDAHPHDKSWLHPSTPISSIEESWLSSPFFFNTAPPEAYRPGSALKPHAFLTGEVDALLAGFDTSNF